MSIYRSSSFGTKTRWNYPLVAVEVVTSENNLNVYIYDVGYEPPFLDVSCLSSTLTFISYPFTLEKGIRFLEEKGIYADNWTLTSNLLAHESNALIREDVRPDIRNIYGYSEKFPMSIDKSVGTSVINSLSKFSGQAVKLHIKFLEKCQKRSNDNFSFSQFHPMYHMYKKNDVIDELRTFTSEGIIQIRSESSSNLAGLMLNNPGSDVALITRVDEKYMCIIVDLSSRDQMCKGEIIEIIIKFLTTDNTITINSNGIV